MPAMPATLAMPCHTTFGHSGHHRSPHRLRPQVADPKLLIAICVRLPVKCLYMLLSESTSPWKRHTLTSNRMDSHGIQ